MDWVCELACTEKRHQIESSAATDRFHGAYLGNYQTPFAAGVTSPRGIALLTMVQPARRFPKTA